MANADSRVTIHMAVSLDGFVARKDGSVDWLDTSDEFVEGATMDPGFVDAQLVNERLRPTFRTIWFVGGGAVSGECMRRGLADEVCYSDPADLDW